MTQKASIGIFLSFFILLFAVGAGSYYLGVFLQGEPEEPTDSTAVPATATQERPQLPSGLTEAERKAFEFPQQGSQEDQLKHFQLVQQAAREADVLTFIDCVADPIVLKVGVDETVVVQNEGPEAILLSIQGEDFPAEPGEERELPFKREDGNRVGGTGIYELTCNSESAGSPAIILVTE